MNLIVTILAVLVFGNLVMAQDERTSIPGPNPIKGPTLGCCKCLEGGNSLDLSTVSANKWTVNSSPVAFVSPISSAWNLSTGIAKWVSTVANGNAPAGDYEYRLAFFVPNCTIDQQITLTGNSGADNEVKVFLDTTGPLAQCGNPGFCFKTPNGVTFSTPVGPGAHTLIVQVKNYGNTSGMFVNATLTSKCSTKLTK